MVASPPAAWRGGRGSSGFNPLHCGAVVASPSPGRARRRGPQVSIPFIAGQWSLRAPSAGLEVPGVVSIPFIAGQWSLREGMDDENIIFVMFQSPSLRGSGRFPLTPAWPGRARRSFNPLHCGAVVASRTRPPLTPAWPVSIPFIAGQWSLQLSEALQRRCTRMFQSPSLRGSGRFGEDGPRLHLREATFQSPSLRGSGRFDPERGRRLENQLEFQSPSLRGSGRFRWPSRLRWRRAPAFQSPSLRGSGRFRMAEGQGGDHGN